MDRFIYTAPHQPASSDTKLYLVKLTPMLMWPITTYAMGNYIIQNIRHVLAYKNLIRSLGLSILHG
jgi:hypothetical protein